MSPPPILGVILAGGLARRMGGGDKPLIRLGGRTLLDRVTERLAPQCEAGLVLSANGDPGRFAGFPGSVLADGVPGNPGPLAGILVALDFAAERGASHRASHSPPRPEVRGEAEPRRSPPDPARPTGGLLRSCFAIPQDEGEGGIGRVLSVSGDAPFLPLDLSTRLHAALDADDTRIALAASGERQHFTVALWPVALRHDLRAALVEHGERRVGAFIARHGCVTVSWPIEPFDPFLNLNTPEDLFAAEAALSSFPE